MTISWNATNNTIPGILLKSSPRVAYQMLEDASPGDHLALDSTGLVVVPPEADYSIGFATEALTDGEYVTLDQETGQVWKSGLSPAINLYKTAQVTQPWIDKNHWNANSWSGWINADNHYSWDDDQEADPLADLTAMKDRYMDTHFTVEGRFDPSINRIWEE